MNGILENLGIDPFYVFIVLFIMQIILIVLLVILNDKYKRLQKTYSVFMRGKNGKSIEKNILKKCDYLLISKYPTSHTFGTLRKSHFLVDIEIPKNKAKRILFMLKNCT